MVFASYIFDVFLPHGAPFGLMDYFEEVADVEKATAGFILGGAVFTQGMVFSDSA